MAKPRVKKSFPVNMSMAVAEGLMAALRLVETRTYDGDHQILPSSAAPMMDGEGAAFVVEVVVGAQRFLRKITVSVPKVERPK